MKKTAAVLAIAMLAGCAAPRGMGASYSPIVDRPGVNYAQDLAECQQHATQVMSTADSAAAGAVAGAIFGLLFAAALGDRHNAGNYAAMGALGAGTTAAGEAEGGQRGIISRCMASRGYTVLN